MKNRILISVCLFLSACTSAPVLAPTSLPGKVFPQVRGESLAGHQVTIPDDYRGKVTVLLVGYQQKTQFDIDRWILGILQAGIPAHIVEVPTIEGMMPQMVQSFIDNGMRSGIPKEDWASVVPVYADASKIVEAIGNERPQSAQVVLLDQSGQIAWTSNRGYSAQQVLELQKVAQGLVDNQR